MLLASPSPNTTDRSRHLDALLELMADLIRSGGPTPQQYSSLNHAIRKVGADICNGCLERGAVMRAVREIHDRHLAGTLQAAALEKRRGYSGDFEMIDAIYTLKTAEAPSLRLWDLFFQAQAAPCAVRNRKAHFHRVLGSLTPPADGSRLRVLNVGCGPGRDLREWFLSNPENRIFFDCVDLDANAIAYASTLCRPFLQHIEFHHENALRYVPSRGYDLVWSAGLFDYVHDKAFVRLLKVLFSLLKPGGRLIVGNFSDFNPSRDYMEIFGDWHLVHRSAAQLLQLAARAGIQAQNTAVDWEPEGVNLFLNTHSG